jgi:hypothetical protein
MASRLQRSISRSLRKILADIPKGASIPESKQFHDIMGDLEFFLPAVLRVIYSEWNQESLDGVFPILARKTGDVEVEILGVCIIISDQRYTPFHLRLQIGASADEVYWFECRLGERGPHGMQTTPSPFLTGLKKRINALEGRADQLEWVYKATFGCRRP